MQALVATLLIPAVFVLALLLAGPVAGLVAAFAVAIYPPLARSPADLLSEPLGALLLVLALIAVVLALRRPAWWRCTATGLLLGALVLTRADLLLVPLIAVGVVGFATARRVSTRAGLRAAGLVLAGPLALVGPWSGYASRAAQEVVVVSTASASNLFVGTYLPGDGRMFGAKATLAAEVRRRYSQYERTRPANVPQTRIIGAVAARRPELDREAAVRAEGLANLRRYALGEPKAFSAMMAGKVGRLWLRYTEGTHGGTRTWMLVLHLALVVASGIGLVLGLWRSGGAELALLALLLLYVTLLNAVLVSEPRHNLPVMPVLTVAGAAGWVLGLRSASRPWRRRVVDGGPPR